MAGFGRLVALLWGHGGCRLLFLLLLLNRLFALLLALSLLLALFRLWRGA